MSSQQLNTPFFHIEGLSLTPEVRQKLIERAMLKETAPEMPESLRMVEQTTETSKFVSSHPANEGIRYNWVGMQDVFGNGETPELDPIIQGIHELWHQETKNRVLYYIVSSTEPYGGMSPHIDRKTFGKNRSAVIFFPLTPYSKEEWSPLRFYKPDGKTADVDFSPCYAADTESVHGIDNNEHPRFCLQVAFSVTVDVLYTLHQQGKLVA